MRAFALCCCLLAACEHAPSYGVAAPDSLGPRTLALPRRLTFNTGDDRHPAVTGAVIVYSRLDGDERGNERCLATLPAAGGTIVREQCPGPPRTAADTFVDTWTEPALSPDGRQVAYLWQQGSTISVLGFWSTSVVVASVDRAGDRSGFVWPIRFLTPGGRVGDAVSAISWADDHTLRLLMGYEFIFKVKGGGVVRYTDTTFQSYGLAELDVATGQFAFVPGGDSAFAYTAAPDGGVWLVRNQDSTRLLHLAPGGDSATAVGAFTGPVRWLASVGGMPAAVVGDSRVEWLEPGDSVPRQLPVGVGEGPLRRIAAVEGTRRFVAEIERGTDLFGDPANLWLYELP
jgi:WD40 repeat protein